MKIQWYIVKIPHFIKHETYEFKMIICRLSYHNANLDNHLVHNARSHMLSTCNPSTNICDFVSRKILCANREHHQIHWKNKLGINAFYQLVCMPCCMMCLHIIYPLIKILITSQYIQYLLFAIKIYGSEKWFYVVLVGFLNNKHLNNESL